MPDTRSASSSDVVPLLALILMAVVALAIGLRAVLSLDALAPVVATLLFMMAAATASVAIFWRKTSRYLDLAGILTFLGVLVSIMIESDQMTRLMSLSEYPE